MTSCKKVKKTMSCAENSRSLWKKGVSSIPLASPSGAVLLELAVRSARAPKSHSHTAKHRFHSHKTAARARAKEQEIDRHGTIIKLECGRVPWAGVGVDRRCQSEARRERKDPVENQ